MANAGEMLDVLVAELGRRPARCDPDRAWLVSLGILEGVQHVGHCMCELHRIVYPHGKGRYSPRPSKKTYLERESSSRLHGRR